MNKRNISKILAGCKFDPKEKLNKVIIDSGSVEYYRLRALEELNKTDLTVANIGTIIKLLVIMIYRMGD